MSSLQLAVLAAVHDMEDEIELSRTEAGLASPSSSEDNSLLINEPSQVTTNLLRICRRDRAQRAAGWHDSTTVEL